MATSTHSRRAGSTFVGPAPSLDHGAPWTLAAIAGLALVLIGTLGFDTTIDVLAVGLQIIFILYFLRHLSFAISASRSTPSDLQAPMLDTGYRPTVSVLVACHDEEAVAEALARHLLALDYPHDRMELVLVDDGSTDRTANILEDALVDARGPAPRARVLRRPAGSGGGKSGALNHGLQLATGEVIVVFDADHRPRPDVLLRLSRHFADPAVAAVQGRCVIHNADDSLLARLISIDYMAGYLVNEYGRQSMYRLPAYGGANCAVRATSLRAAGGWNPDTVTEDTDLTLRLVLRGEVVRYDVTAVDEEEGVTTLTRYWRQRYRWARGHQQVWRDYRRAVLSSDHLNGFQKGETLLFLFAFHLPVVGAAGLTVLLAWATGLAQPVDPISGFVLWTLLFLGPMLEVGAGLMIARADRRNARALVFFMPLYAVGMAVCTKVWFDGVLGRPYSWVKTRRAGDAVTAEVAA